MNDEQYENLIELLKQALLFYADKENYLFYKKKDAPIALDEGSQARFALEKINEIMESNDKMKAIYMEDMRDAFENNENPENILKIIEQFKNIANGD